MNRQARGTHFLESAEGGKSEDHKESEKARGTHQLEST
jgi:hypothetical protein